MKKTLLINFVILIILVNFAYSLNEIIENQEGYSSATAFGCTSNHRVYCSNFTGLADYDLLMTGIRIIRTSSPTNYIQFGIFTSDIGYSDVGEEPAIRLSYSNTMYGIDFPSYESSWFNFTYNGTVKIEKDTNYWLCGNTTYFNDGCVSYIGWVYASGIVGKAVLRNPDHFEYPYPTQSYINDYGSNYQTNFRNYNYSECSENIINTTWSEWLNLTCLFGDTINQSRYLTEYDNNYCGYYENITYWEYRNTEFCDYCIPNITNTSYSEWLNISECFYGDYINKSQYFTEYDVNLCGETANITHYEYDLDYCLYIQPIILKYNISLLPEDIYNKDVFNTNTITGVFMFIFVFLILCGIAVLGEVTRIPIFMFITGFLGVFFGLLIFTTISTIFGAILVILSGLYLLSIFLR